MALIQHCKLGEIVSKQMLQLFKVCIVIYMSNVCIGILNNHSWSAWLCNHCILASDAKSAAGILCKATCRFWGEIHRQFLIESHCHVRIFVTIRFVWKIVMLVCGQTWSIQLTSLCHWHLSTVWPGAVGNNRTNDTNSRIMLHSRTWRMRQIDIWLLRSAVRCNHMRLLYNVVHLFVLQLL